MRSAVRQRRMLVPRPADAANVNAQAKNAQQILRHWRSRELRPAVVAFEPPDPDITRNPNVEIIMLRHDRFWRAALIRTYLQRFDAIFYPGLHHYADWLALQIRRLSGNRIPIIDTMEGVLAAMGDDTRELQLSEAAGHRVYAQKLSPAHLRRVDAIYAMSDHIIAISPFLARMASELYGDKVSMLPLGVDTGLFRRPTADRPVRPRIVGAGSVAGHKRPGTFVDLARAFPMADFAWFGEGELRAGLIEQSAGLDNLSFPGAKSPPELAGEFARSDIFALPSLSEGVPKVTQEAAASGLAQVIFGFYEAPTVVDGLNGFVVWDDEQLVDRLGRLIADRGLADRMGREGARMAADWSWANVAPQWERRIIEVLDARGATSARSAARGRSGE